MAVNKSLKKERHETDHGPIFTLRPYELGIQETLGKYDFAKPEHDRKGYFNFLVKGD